VLVRRNIRFRTNMKMLNCFVLAALNSGYESWTWNNALRKKVNAFEYWCCKRMLKISWKDKVQNEVILSRVQTKLHFMEDIMKRKLRY